MQKTVEQLGKLFGSTAQVKCMRLFLQHPDEAFAIADIALRTKSTRGELNRALKLLKAIGFITPKKAVVRKKLKNGKVQTKRVAGYELKKNYPLIPHLFSLLIESGVITPSEIETMFVPVGKVHRLVLSGFFMQDPDRALDLLLVADKLKERVLVRAVKLLESEIGREVRYAYFSPAEYQYRMNMYDKLLRDVFDYPHLAIVDKTKR